MNKKPFLFAAKQLFLMPLLFAVVYALIFYIRRESILQEFNILVSEIPSLVRFGSNAVRVVTDYFPKFGALGGVAFGLIQMILAFVIYLVMKIARISQWKPAVPLVLFIALLPLAFFGHNMVFVSSRFTALSSGIILFIGYPLWYASLVLLILLAFILLYGFLKKVRSEKALMVGLMVGASMMLSGCDMLNWLFSSSCEFSDDSSHCYQEAAVASGQADECDKVTQPADFGSSNPPKDKCYLMVAENTGDPTACDKVAGGAFSYTREECLANVFSNGNPEKCAGLPNEKECRDMYAQHSGVDSECADPSFTSQCAGSHSLLICSEGKKRIENCEFGCFEAACRSTAGETDLAPAEPEPADEHETSDGPLNGAGDPADQEDEEEEEVVECEEDADCFFGATCKAGVCIDEPECGKKDFYCLSTHLLQTCADGLVDYEDCDYGCENSRCLTKEEKEKRDAEEAKKCKEGTHQCLSDYTAEICENGEKVIEKCAFGCEKGECRATKKKNCTGFQRLNPFCSEDDDDIEDKVETDISTIRDALSSEYMDLLQQAIDDESNPSKRRGLEAYQSFLNQAGDKMEELQTTIDDLKNIKRIFLDSYDPSMDIENMGVDKILKPGIFERIKTSIFGGPKTPAGIEMAEAEDSLSVYEAMLVRQAEIDFLKQSRMERLGQVVTDKVKGDMVDQLKDKATDIAGSIAGDAMIAVTVMDYALTSFQDEAKKQSFIGLARAYNRRRADLQASNPDMSEEDIHRRAVEQVKEDPYRDAKGNVFIKYGNILENADCKEGTGNQLCIDNHVFWTAMDKTYRHTHKKAGN